MWLMAASETEGLSLPLSAAAVPLYSIFIDGEIKNCNVISISREKKR